MSPNEHYEAAETLLREGYDTASKIRNLDEARKGWAEGDDGWLSLTRQMDEYGKKAMGIWAQALVHATLANAPLEQIEVR